MRALIIIIYLILFYIIWKFIKVLIKSYRSSQYKSHFEDTKNSNEKYRNIEDAKFTEIKDEDDKEKKDSH